MTYMCVFHKRNLPTTEVYICLECCRFCSYLIASLSFLIKVTGTPASSYVARSTTHFDWKKKKTITNPIGDTLLLRECLFSILYPIS